MAGAMAPDLIYFLQLTTTSRGLGHSWSGLLLFCLPAGVAFSFAFHWLFKYNFISNLPNPLDKILSGLATSSFTVTGFRVWSIFILSLMVGTLSHFFWDSFTHQDGVLAQAIPILTQRSRLFGFSILNARILQHVSTVAGIVGLVFGLWKLRLLPATQADFKPRKATAKLLFWFGHGLAATGFAALVVMLFDRFLPNHPVSQLAIFGLSGWSGFFYSVAIYAVMARLREPRLIFTNSR
jgi:hypothetical protein